MGMARVDGCCDCPFCHHYAQSGAGDDYCEHPDSNEDANLSYPETILPPTWCPLRAGPVTVELEAQC